MPNVLLLQSEPGWSAGWQAGNVVTVNDTTADVLVANSLGQLTDLPATPTQVLASFVATIDSRGHLLITIPGAIPIDAGRAVGADGTNGSVANLPPATSMQVTPTTAIVGVAPDGVTAVLLSPQQLASIPLSTFGQMIAGTIAGNGTTGPYALPQAPVSSAYLLVFVNGTFTTAWTVSGTNLTFTSAVAAGATIAYQLIVPISSGAGTLISNTSYGTDPYYITDKAGFIFGSVTSSRLLRMAGAQTDAALGTFTLQDGNGNSVAIIGTGQMKVGTGIIYQMAAASYNFIEIVTDPAGFIIKGILNGAPISIPSASISTAGPISGASLTLPGYQILTLGFTYAGVDNFVTDGAGFIISTTTAGVTSSFQAITKTPTLSTDPISFSYFTAHALTSGGGTLTAPIYYSGTPSGPTELINKQYVDTAVATASGGAPAKSASRISHQFLSSGAGGILAGKTYHVTYEAESDFDMVRLVFVQDQSAQWSIDNAVVASSASLADLVSPVDTTGAADVWAPVTWARRGKDGDPVGLGQPDSTDVLAQNLTISIAGNGTAGPYTVPQAPLSTSGIYAVVGSTSLVVQTLSGLNVTFTSVIASGSTITGYIVVPGTAQSTTLANAATSLIASDMPVTSVITRNAIVMSDWVPKQSYVRTDVSGARPVLMARVSNVSSNLYLPSNDSFWSQMSGGLYTAPPVMASFEQNGNFATPATAAGMTTALSSSYSRLISSFQIMSRKRGFVVLGIGDSITQGLGIYTYRAVTSLSCSGTTATALIDNSDGQWIVGSYLIINGASVAGYNVATTCTAVTTTSVTFTLPSTSSGLAPATGGTAGYLVRSFDGWGRRACARLSTQALPVTWFNQAVRGTASVDYCTNAISYIDKIKPQAVTIPAFTPNNGIGPTPSDLAWTHAMQVYEYALRKGVVPIIFNPVPCSGALGYISAPNMVLVGQAIQKNLAKARELGASNGGYIIDAFNTIALANGDGTYSATAWAATMSDDGTHPTDAGHNAIATAFLPVLETVLGT